MRSNEEEIPNPGSKEAAKQAEAIQQAANAVTGEMKALITDGHNLDLIISDLLDLLDGADTNANDRYVIDLCIVADNRQYEWRKRASRAGVDWWNRDAR